MSSLVALLAPFTIAPSMAWAQDAGPPPAPPAAAPSDEEFGWEIRGSASTDGDSSLTTEGERDADPAPAEPAPVQPLAGATDEGTADAEEEYSRWRRSEALHAHNSLRGSTGLLRVHEAGSGPVGSFRFGVYGGLYAGSGFLCSDTAACFDASGARLGNDDVDRMMAQVTLSATPLPYLEAFLGFYNTATSNSRGRPQLLQVLGDANLGVKVFTPAEADRIFSFGGEAELMLLNGTGGVGLDGGSTSFALRALSTMDLHNRRKPEDRIPLRAHVNVGYMFNNSAAVVEGVENTPPPQGRGQPVHRIERFGLGISRVDNLQIGLGTEFIHEFVRPFVEWSIDVPVNRQDYVCHVQGAEGRGDICLGADGRISNMPSRFSLGARVYPWRDHGLAFTAAADIATGGSSRFLEETTPEVPYTLWLGVAYAVDTQPPPIIQRVEVARDAAPAPRRYLTGTVVDGSSGAPVPHAILHYEGQDRTGMAASAAGAFQSADLPPGNYTLLVTAEGYKEGRCEVTVPGPTPAAPTRATDRAASDATASNAEGDVLVPVECKLDPLPKVATITGVLVDGTSGAPIARATVKVTDKLGRELELTADDAGAFQFRNVPFGSATVTASAPDYLTTATSFEITSRKDIEARLSLNKRPEKPNVEVTDKELKLKRQVHFLHASADLLPDSVSILEEIAEALKAHPEITRVEIQGHTDNTGQADYNRKLSQERAESVRNSLLGLGIDEKRLVAKGYGPDKPLVPNTNDANRARNRRVQLIVLERGGNW